MDPINLESPQFPEGDVVFDVPWYSIDEQLSAKQASALAETVPEHVARIGGPELRPLFNSGRGVKIGIVDTGISKAHINNGELKIVDAKDFTGSRYGYDDANGHSTHVSGIIAAQVNGNGTSSILPECELYVAKGLGDSGSGGDSGLASAIMWLIEQGVHVMSLSWGSSGPSSRIYAALQEAVAAGISVCAASGNSGHRGTIYPARHNDVCLSVAAVDFNDQITSFSSRGNDVDVADDGNQVYSTYRGGTFARLSGTSMATPNLAAKMGAIKALEIKHLGQHIPRTPVEMVEFIKSNNWFVDRGQSGADPSYGNGTITTSFMKLITEYDAMLAEPGPGPGPDPDPSFEPIPLTFQKDIHIPAGKYVIVENGLQQ